MERYTIRDVAQILEATEAQVRQWARLGGIAGETGDDGGTRFSFQDLLLLRTTRGMLESGVTPRRMQSVWEALRRQVQGDTPLTSITLAAEGRRAIASDGVSRWRPESGQFLIDFGAGEPPPAGAAVLTIDELCAERARGRKPPAPERRPPDGGARVVSEDGPATAAQWFALACELEGEAPLEARSAYRRALDLDPDFTDAHVNLGRHYHEAGELGKAEAHYRDAVRCAPDDAIAHFNLGVLLEDRARQDEAVHAYEQALARDADLADAHYNLGLLLEARRRRPDAIRHLMRAREIYDRAAPHD